MGRPRVHDERTAAALLEAAERIAETDGWEALSVRRIADSADTTTRAVYSVFGSMGGVLGSLGARGFDLLHDYIEHLPLTADPVADVVAAGAVGFRGWVREHRALFEISVQRGDLPRSINSATRAASQRAWQPLYRRLERLPEGHLQGRPIDVAGFQFHVVCEGLASTDLRYGISGQLPTIWEDTLRVLVTGWAHAVPGWAHSRPA